MEPAVGHGHPNVHTGTRILCGVGRARTKSFNATVNVRSTNVGGSGASVRAISVSHGGRRSRGRNNHSRRTRHELQAHRIGLSIEKFAKP